MRFFNRKYYSKTATPFNFYSEYFPTKNVFRNIIQLNIYYVIAVDSSFISAGLRIKGTNGLLPGVRFHPIRRLTIPGCPGEFDGAWFVYIRHSSSWRHEGRYPGRGTSQSTSEFYNYSLFTFSFCSFYILMFHVFVMQLLFYYFIIFLFYNKYWCFLNALHSFMCQSFL